MKSTISYSLTTLLVVLLVALCSLNSGADAKTLVRGDHRPKTLKHFSMHSRQLMQDKEKDEDEDEDEEKEDKNKDKEDEDEEEVEAAEEDEETEAPVVESAVEEEATEEEVTEEVVEEVTEEEGMNMTTTEEEVIGTFEVALEPFSLTIDGDIDQADLNLDAYLLTYMQGYLSNLVAIDLTVQVVDNEDEEPMEEGTNSTRSLRAFQAARFLTVQTFYFEGKATFEGAPMRSKEEVDAFLTEALQDTAALQAHLEASSPSSNATITGTKPSDPAPSADAAIGPEESGDEEGLSTTGLSIVIVAACVGGLSLIVILMVGLSGPSGAAGGKNGLPEQPLQ